MKLKWASSMVALSLGAIFFGVAPVQAVAQDQARLRPLLVGSTLHARPAHVYSYELHVVIEMAPRLRREVMRTWILSACIAFALPCSAFPQRPAAAEQTARSAPSQNKTAQVQLAVLLEAKVRATWAMFQKKDKDGYAEFLTDDFQAVEADGDGERPKSHLLREVEHSQNIDYLLQLFQVQPLGANYAFVTYESTIQFPQGSATRYRRIFIGELWTKRDGQWKMMRYQETPVR